MMISLINKTTKSVECKIDAEVKANNRSHSLSELNINKTK